MKRCFYVIFSLLFLTVLCSCVVNPEIEKKQTAEKMASTQSAPSSDEVIEKEITEEAKGASIEILKLKFQNTDSYCVWLGMTAAEFEKQMNVELQNHTLTTILEDGISALLHEDAVIQLVLEDSQWSTTDGLKTGLTKDQVVALLGEPNYTSETEEENVFFYYNEQGDLDLHFDTAGCVTKIDLASVGNPALFVEHKKVYDHVPWRISEETQETIEVATPRDYAAYPPVVNENGQTIRLGMTREELGAVLGIEIHEDTVQLNLEALTPLQMLFDQDILVEFYFSTPWNWEDGVGIGNSKEEILTALGQPDMDTGSEPGASPPFALIYELEKGSVTYVYDESERITLGRITSVSSEEKAEIIREWISRQK